MTQKKLRIISSFLFLLAFLGFQIYKQYFPSKNVLSLQQKAIQPDTKTVVTKVVDGDTIDVLIKGTKEKIRVIGINTPETVDPRRPVECFGIEASNYAKSLLLNQTVILTSDPTQASKDKYGRLLRYVSLLDGTDFGLRMITNGYAYEYTYEIPYQRQDEYKKAQKDASEKSVGLWSSASCSGKK